jgi:lysylphosphatidylglycerol synthetase-like protein (DUF2156 family)
MSRATWPTARRLTRGQCRCIAGRIYDRAVSVGEVTPGYELWHPNREKADVITTKFAIAFLMLATAVVAALITIGGFSLLSGGGGMGVLCLIFAILYAFFAFLVTRWSRGILPVAASLSTILAIFCAVGANSWFARDKSGFDEALLPSSLIGLLVIVLLLLQIVLVVACFYGFSQDWHVEEERPIGSGEDYGAGAPPNRDAPQPA